MTALPEPARRSEDHSTEVAGLGRLGRVEVAVRVDPQDDGIGMPLGHRGQSAETGAARVRREHGNGAGVECIAQGVSQAEQRGLCLRKCHRPIVGLGGRRESHRAGFDVEQRRQRLPHQSRPFESTARAIGDAALGDDEREGRSHPLSFALPRVTAQTTRNPHRRDCSGVQPKGTGPSTTARSRSACADQP